MRFSPPVERVGFSPFATNCLDHARIGNWPDAVKLTAQPGKCFADVPIGRLQPVKGQARRFMPYLVKDRLIHRYSTNG
jgi:hypothetical protein